MIDEQEFLADLRAHIARKYVTRKIAAMHWGMSDSYLSLVVNGSRPPSQKILKDMGYQRQKIVSYTKVK